MPKPSTDKAPRPIRSSIAEANWQAQQNIWRRDPVTSRLDMLGSRDAQPDSWIYKNPRWPQGSSAHQGPAPSGSSSPTRTRDGFQYSFPEVSSDSDPFSLRSVGVQNELVQTRTLPPGPADHPPSSMTYQTSFGESVNDERGTSNLYASNSNGQIDYEASGAYRRNSNDPQFLSLGHSRTLSSRQPESDVQNSHRYSDSLHYFPKAPGRTKAQPQRPSVSGASVTLASEQGRSNPFAFGAVDPSTHDIEESIARVTLENGTDAISSTLLSNGHVHPASQAFQPTPVSQAWQHDLGSNPRLFGQSVQDSWGDPAPSIYASRRGLSERGSSASSYRAGISSPRTLSGTPNQRADTWGRPGSQNPRALQELDRVSQGSQYLQQQPGFYQAPYYGNSLAQYSAPYDQYGQNPSFRSQVQLPGYGLQMNFSNLPVPLRPSRDQDPGKGVRSVLLEEFRSNAKSNKRYELKDIYNHIVEFSGDQHGSRFIQEKLQTANSDEKDQVFREIEPNTLQLMKDVFGNYVIQKFFEHGNQVQKKIIAAQMKGKVAELSTQMYACRVVQKALEHVLVEQQHEIVEELKSDIMRIVKDQNGNHVIQKIIQMLPQQCIPFIMDAFQNQIESLASHNYGCRVIQRILEHGTEAEKKSLMTDLHACAIRLITDQYGNYVTQHIIAHGEPEDRRKIIQLVLQRLIFFSKHKFASNVVEKSIEFGTMEDRRAITSQITALHSDGTSPLQLMMKDQYGNYVIQKLMQHLEGPDRESFIEEMRPHFASLKKASSGRQTAVLDRLISASEASGGAAAASPTTPNSVTPTPLLTMEQNSPESSSPPSTKASLEVSLDEKNSKASPLKKPCQPVEVSEP
ncbi:ARM repeat-containing protein [Daldinia eschscholtzii]|nr:ARM repeat-containing protein [Daldinia eschscholtzii]